ncbi:MAG: imidazolonepropionase [Planctomycetota bacterium]
MHDPLASSGAPSSPAGAPLSIDLMVTGAAEVATPLGSAANAGAALGRIAVHPGHGVACDAGRILAVAPDAELRARFAPRQHVDAAGGVVIPGLVDAHTHPVFDGTREAEFEQRMAGATYLEIAAAGGGIRSSLAGVRRASAAGLTAKLLARLDRFLALGTTTLEAKTGYGLTVADELKGLEVIAAADRAHPIELIATCLGAHSVPPEHLADPARWERIVIEELWPAAASRARFADVFTESHVFGLDASRRLMQAAKDVGLGVRMHVDQLTPLGGAELAAELGAASADHLEHVTPRGIEALARAGVVPVLCPLVPLYLREPQEAPARRMVEGGLAPALSTDFNPGSCYCMSLFEVMSFAALRYGFSAAEALTGATLNAAASLGLAADRGSIEVGKRADLVVTDLPNHHHLTYEVGRSPAVTVIKDGRVVWRRDAVGARGLERCE